MISENKFDLSMLEKNNLEALTILLIKSLGFYLFFFKVLSHIDYSAKKVKNKADQQKI